MTGSGPAGTPNAGTRRETPAWLVATLVGIGLALLGLVGFYFGIYLALGGQPVLSGLVMFGLVPLVSLAAGWLLRPRFGASWVKWTLVAFAAAAIAEVLAAVIVGLLGNPGLISRVGLLGVLQQALGLPFALVTAWLAGRSGRR